MNPSLFAASIVVPNGLCFPSASTDTAPLYVFCAHEKAVAPAAESVTSEFDDRVREEPTRILSSGKAKGSV